MKSAEPDEYPELIEQIVKPNMDRQELLKVLREPIAPSPSKERLQRFEQGWTDWTAKDSNGVERPYTVYANQAIANGESPEAVVMHMHGAVARPDFGSTGYASMLWPALADEHNLLIVCPKGRADCVWWSDSGVSNINAVLRDIKRTLPIPDQSIFGTGFSDGASGCYYLAMVTPDPFAGFIAMNGHPAVAATASGKQLYLQNMRQTPTIAAMTQDDSLYPTQSLLPHLNMAIKAGAPIWLISYANANHQPTFYFDDQKPQLIKFFKKQKRTSNPNRIRWQTSDTSVGRVSWLEVKSIGETKWDAPAWDELNLMTEPRRVSLGIELESFSSTSVKRVIEILQRIRRASKRGTRL